jgi:hypothetical protein
LRCGVVIGTATALHRGECILAHAQKSISEIGAIRRNHGIQQPAPFAKQNRRDEGCPRHPNDIKHVLRQAGSCQIFARALESAGCGIVFGSARRLEDIFADETGNREEAVDEQRSRAEEEVREEEEHVDDEGSDVQVVEGGRIGLGAVLFRFLSHCYSFCDCLVSIGCLEEREVESEALVKSGFFDSRLEEPGLAAWVGDPVVDNRVAASGGLLAAQWQRYSAG